MTDALHIADGYSARPYGDGYIIHHEFAPPLWPNVGGNRLAPTQEQR